MGTAESESKTRVAYPWSSYTLKLAKKGKIAKTRFVLYAAQIAALIILSWLSVVTMQPLSYAGIPLFFFVYPFLLVFTMWWGAWGIAGAYIGCALGAGLMIGLDTGTSLAYSISYLVPALFAFLIYRGFLSKRGFDPLWRDLTDGEVGGVKAKRAGAWAWFILINGVVLNAISAILGVGIQYLMQPLPGGFWFVWAGWFIGDLVATVVLTPLLVKGLSGLVEKKGLANLGWIA